jgi:hypothetical protein
MRFRLIRVDLTCKRLNLGRGAVEHSAQQSRQIGSGAHGQIIAPGRFKSQARGLEGGRGAVSIVAGASRPNSLFRPQPELDRTR